jgi:hypothetical protein
VVNSDHVAASSHVVNSSDAQRLLGFYDSRIPGKRRCMMTEQVYGKSVGDTPAENRDADLSNFSIKLEFSPCTPPRLVTIVT